MNDFEFAELFKTTKKTVLSAIEKYLAARFVHSINDVVQETYLRAFNGLKKQKFKGDSPLNTWLYTIAKNESLRMNEKLVREEKKFEKSVIEFHNSKKELNPDELNPDIIVLKELIISLPDKYRTVMELVSIGLQEKEISNTLSIPRGTVKSRTSKGRELLHRLWTGGDII